VSPRIELLYLEPSVLAFGEDSVVWLGSGRIVGHLEKARISRIKNAKSGLAP